jgi:hypothetical protein
MKLKRFIMPLLFAAVFVSCEENFNPLGEYSERYVLNCVVKADTSLQVATISQSYLGGSVDPFENTADPSLENVFLRLWYEDEVYIFKDSVITRQDTSRYDTPVKVYYLDNLKPEPGGEFEIEALLSNGRRLNAKTRIPARPKKTLTGTSNVIPPEDGDEIKLFWQSDELGLLYHPRIHFLYIKTENGARVMKKAYLPVDYYNDGGNLTPIYPIPSQARNLSIKMSTITRLMNAISEGDDNKRDYEFLYAAVELIVFDRNLSLYFASSNTILDEYSIKLDETDFTNVDGGYGLFGSLVKGVFTIKFDTEYLQNFGYRNGF